MDEKDIACLSLVDAAIHNSTHLKLRPSQTKVEPTSSQSVVQGNLNDGGLNDGGRVDEQASKGDASGSTKLL